MSLEKQCGLSQKKILENLEKGLEGEYKALELCEELIDLLDNEEEKKIIHWIAEDEKKHIKITQNLIEIVRKNYKE